MENFNLKQAIDGLTAHVVEQALIRTNGNRTHAAHLMKISLVTIRALIKRHGLEGRFPTSRGPQRASHS